MLICRIVGDVVSTQKNEMLQGYKLLLVQPVDISTQQPQGVPFVAVDSAGAGIGEIVLVVAGSSSRLTEVTKDRPCDAVIMGIIDYITVEGKRTFTKSILI